MAERTRRRAEHRRVPRGRTGQPVRPSSALRRVELGCGHGWVRDPVATAGTWTWCESCADWARVLRVAE